MNRAGNALSSEAGGQVQRDAETERQPVAGSVQQVPGRSYAAARRRRLVRMLSWVMVASSVLVAGTAAVALLLDHDDGRTHRIGGVVAAPAEPPTSREPLDVLVVGSDSREGLTGEEAFQGTGRESITGQRSDVVILVHLFAGRRPAQLVSLPRDAFVEIPAHTSPTAGRAVAARRDRLNSAFDRGGPALLVDTVRVLTGVEVDHYVQVDFRGFKRLVDQLGGVEVCLSAPQRETRSGIDLQAGRQTVQREQPLAFVRQRAGLARGDLERIQRQQLLLGALVRKVLSTGTLLNPVKLNGVLQAAWPGMRCPAEASFLRTTTAEGR
jgi:LCP family protein required for cell wall assembly